MLSDAPPMLAAADEIERQRGDWSDGLYFVRCHMAEQTIKTMEIPLDHRDKQTPMITSTMKQYCMGEFEWQEDAPYYDENGELHEHTATHTVPWDLCKRIYKQMATMANGSPEMELEREI